MAGHAVGAGPLPASVAQARYGQIYAVSYAYTEK
jgi:hypothetical protein